MVSLRQIGLTSYLMRQACSPKVHDKAVKALDEWPIWHYLRQLVCTDIITTVR